MPKNYQGDKPFPLIMALHGLGGTEDALFNGYGRQLPQLAEQHGYRVDGGYGTARPCAGRTTAKPT